LNNVLNDICKPINWLKVHNIFTWLVCVVSNKFFFSKTLPLPDFWLRHWYWLRVLSWHKEKKKIKIDLSRKSMCVSKKKEYKSVNWVGTVDEMFACDVNLSIKTQNKKLMTVATTIFLSNGSRHIRFFTFA